MFGLADVSEEIFYKICFYLDINDLIALSAVCNKFFSYLNRQLYWKLRSQTFFKGVYPCINGKHVNWKNVQCDREKCVSIFGNNNSNCFRNCFAYAVSHGIDTVHIPSEYPHLFLAGNRARVLSVFSFKNVLTTDNWTPIFCEPRSHSGWIWTVNSCGDTVITGSWDGALRVWSLTHTGLLFRSIYQLGTPVLCSSFLSPNLLAVGTHCRDVYLIDLRSPIEHSTRMRHKKSVLCMDSVFEVGLRTQKTTTMNHFDSDSFYSNSIVAMPSGDQFCLDHSELSSIAASDECLNLVVDSFDHGLDSTKSETDKIVDLENVHVDQTDTSGGFSNINLVTGSSDQFLAGWDLRNGSEPVSKYKLASSYPRKISLLDEGELWVAEPPNRIHVFDIRNNRFHCAFTNNLSGWTRGFGGLKVTSGCVFACGLNGVVQAFHPTCPLIPISNGSLEEKVDSLPTSLEYYDGVLAVGSGNGSVHIWSTVEKLKTFNTC